MFHNEGFSGNHDPHWNQQRGAGAGRILLSAEGSGNKGFFGAEVGEKLAARSTLVLLLGVFGKN
jgi:hypothetical protein